MLQEVVMKIVVNGQERALAAPMTVAALLDELGMAGKRVAVEVNQEIVPRSRHAEFRLNESDRVEVVFAIGGG
jgi:sulfur carrier protein